MSKSQSEFLSLKKLCRALHSELTNFSRGPLPQLRLCNVTEDMKKTLDPAQFGNQKGMGDPALSGRAAGLSVVCD